MQENMATLMDIEQEWKTACAKATDGVPAVGSLKTVLLIGTPTAVL
jgi:hypothetical protein